MPHNFNPHLQETGKSKNSNFTSFHKVGFSPPIPHQQQRRHFCFNIQVTLSRRKVPVAGAQARTLEPLTLTRCLHETLGVEIVLAFILGQKNSQTTTTTTTNMSPGSITSFMTKIPSNHVESTQVLAPDGGLRMSRVWYDVCWEEISSPL